MAVDPARAKSLFLNASDLADPAERAAYLERECGRDAELRHGSRRCWPPTTGADHPSRATPAECPDRPAAIVEATAAVDAETLPPPAPVTRHIVRTARLHGRAPAGRPSRRIPGGADDCRPL